MTAPAKVFKASAGYVGLKVFMEHPGMVIDPFDFELFASPNMNMHTYTVLRTLEAEGLIEARRKEQGPGFGYVLNDAGREVFKRAVDL
jgi:predicted transcriptional regulator